MGLTPAISARITPYLYVDIYRSNISYEWAVVDKNGLVRAAGTAATLNEALHLARETSQTQSEGVVDIQVVW